MNDLMQAYRLINTFIREFPACNCHEAYANRGLIAPDCVRHNAIDDDLYDDMVAWRDKMTDQIIQIVDEVVRV